MIVNAPGFDRNFIIIDPSSGTCYGELKGANAALVAGYIQAISERFPRGDALRGYRVGNNVVSLGQVIVGYTKKIFVATTGVNFKSIPTRDVGDILNSGKYRDGVLSFVKTGDTRRFPEDTLPKLSSLTLDVRLPPQTRVDLDTATPAQIDILAAMRHLQQEDEANLAPTLEYFAETEDGKLTRVAVSRTDLEKKLQEPEHLAVE